MKKLREWPLGQRLVPSISPKKYCMLCVLRDLGIRLVLQPIGMYYLTYEVELVVLGCLMVGLS